jgi:hypothetical protein
MKYFKKTIDNTEFNFKYLREGTDVLFLVNVETSSFRMITDEEGNWGIWQQVPSWIKKVEEELADAIEENYKGEEA